MPSSRRPRRSRAGGARSADRSRPDPSAAPHRSADAASGASAYATGYHDPVLLRETLDLLTT
ncbi:MAG: hypothetical protein AAFQ43_02360, partial [Bacteroidota bacterium]